MIKGGLRVKGLLCTLHWEERAGLKNPHKKRIPTNCGDEQKMSVHWPRPLLLVVMEYKKGEYSCVYCIAKPRPVHIKPPSANQPSLFVTEEGDEEEGCNSFCQAR